MIHSQSLLLLKGLGQLTTDRAGLWERVKFKGLMVGDARDDVSSDEMKSLVAV